MIPEWLYSKKLTYRKEIRQILGIKFAFPRVTKIIAFVETQGLGDYILIHNFYKFQNPFFFRIVHNNPKNALFLPNFGI